MRDDAFEEICCAICKQAVYDWKQTYDLNTKQGKELQWFFDTPFFTQWSGLKLKDIEREVPRPTVPPYMRKKKQKKGNGDGRNEVLHGND